MKFVARLVVILCLLALIPVFMADRVAEKYLVRALEKSTGLNVSLGSMKVGVVKPVITLRDLKLTNPPDFPHPDAFYIREMSMHYNRLSLLGRELHLNNLTLDIPRVVMVKPEQGPSNLELIAGLGSREKQVGGGQDSQGEKSDAPSETKPKSKDKTPRTVVIDVMNVKMGEMEVRQYRRDRDEPVVMNIPVNFDRTYHNVTNLESVAIQMSTELVLQSSVAFLGQLGNLLANPDGDSREQQKQMKEQLKNLKQMFR
ncbi:MAG TPA: hypothetical protein PJ991_09805 [Kiritimatiellia bacterium]|nr:hypothetical protein [Kiritimatiellia bacterium]